MKYKLMQAQMRGYSVHIKCKLSARIFIQACAFGAVFQDGGEVMHSMLAIVLALAFTMITIETNTNAITHQTQGNG